MLDFQLFRIRVLPSKQGELFDAELSRPEMLQKVIVSLPQAEFRAGQIWHIGNVSAVNAKGMYFRLGRTSISTLEIFDEEKGSFIDQEFETAPYTHALLDMDLEVCAIAKKTRLSPTTAGIARQLARLLSESKNASELRVTFEIDDLKDPEDFISQLKQAYTISKFWISFSRPNAFDVNEDFVKPFQRMVEVSNSEKGKAELKGQDLNSAALEDLARSAASTGDNASARLKASEQARPVTKQLTGSSVNISQETIDNVDEQKLLLDGIRRLYKKIRGDGNTQ